MTPTPMTHADLVRKVNDDWLGLTLLQEVFGRPNRYVQKCEQEWRYWYFKAIHSGVTDDELVCYNNRTNQMARAAFYSQGEPTP